MSGAVARCTTATPKSSKNSSPVATRDNSPDRPQSHGPSPDTKPGGGESSRDSRYSDGLSTESVVLETVQFMRVFISADSTKSRLIKLPRVDSSSLGISNGKNPGPGLNIGNISKVLPSKLQFYDDIPFQTASPPISLPSVIVSDDLYIYPNLASATQGRHHKEEFDSESCLGATKTMSWQLPLTLERREWERVGVV